MGKVKIGCSPLTSQIYSGVVLQNGMWSNTKHDVTDTAPAAVAQHLLQKDESIEFNYGKDGKRYRLQVVEVQKQ